MASIPLPNADQAIGRFKTSSGETSVRADGYWFRFFSQLVSVVNAGIRDGNGAPVTKTANFAVGATEHNVIINKASSSCVVTLPTAADWPGREIWIKTLQAQTVVSASSNVVPRNSATAGTAILSASAGQWARLVSDGSNWVIMAGS